MPFLTSGTNKFRGLHFDCNNMVGKVACGQVVGNQEFNKI